MTNESFLLLSEEGRSTKLRAVLKAKTGGYLTEQELQSMLSYISPNRQYRVLVYFEKPEFFQLLAAAQDSRQTILPQTVVWNENGRMLEEDRAVAVISQKQSEENGMNQISIYIPKTRFQKGKNHER